MRYLQGSLLCLLFTIAPPLSAQEAIFAPGAKLKIEAGGGAGGEGPAWHPKLGLLTSGNGHIYQLDRAGKSIIYRKGAGTNGLLFDRMGRLLACEPDLRHVTRTEPDGTITVLTDRYQGKRYNTPNDLTVDSQGRIYFSDPRYGSRAGMEIRDEKGRTVEGVYRIDPDLKVTRVIGREVDRANGVLVSADDRYLYVADNNNDTVGAARKLWRFNLGKDSNVDFASKKLIYDWGTGRGPDGVKHDQKGRLYVAAGLNKPNPPAEPADDVKGGVYVLSPDGKLLAFLPVPTDEVTNCAFGGDDLKTLYITGGGTIYSIRTTTPGRVVWPSLAGAGSEPSFKRQEDVIYGRKFGSALTMDVFTPAKQNGAAVIWVVSGGWMSAHEAINAMWIAEYVGRGYTVFAVVHGSQPRYAIPEILQDMHRAVRFIRSNAARFGIDADRLGITGASAGGHLSLMQGAAGKDGDSDAKDPIERASSHVQAVGCFVPPTDFLNWGEKGKLVIPEMPEFVKPAFDFRERNTKTGGFVRITDAVRIKTILRETSPITHVSSKSAPTLIIHGEKDTLVPIQQAEIMVAALKEAGVTAELVVKTGAGHVWVEMIKDQATIADWFDKHLVKNAAAK
jgi:gluconolactonase